MTIQMILAPVFVQVALTLFLLVWIGRTRRASVARGETKVRDIALGQPAWPAKATQVSNCYNSQFQLPVLFYVAVILAVITKSADLIFVVLSWLFVLARLGHAYIHTTSNHVPTRFNVFALSMLVLLIMWIWIGMKIYLA